MNEESAQERLTGHRHSRRWLVAGYCLALLLLVGIVVYGSVESRRAAAARAQVTHTLLVLQHAQKLENATLAMEASHRGYLLTRDSGFRDRRDGHLGDVREEAATLIALVSDNPGQSARVKHALAAVEHRHTLMQQTGTLLEEEGLEAARTRFHASGDGSIEPVRLALRKIGDEEQRLLAERSARSTDNAARFDRALVYGTGLALFVLAGAGVLLLRQLLHSERIGTQLADSSHRISQLNHDLTERSRALETSNRELEAFSYSVSHDLRAPLRHIDGYARMLIEDIGAQLDTEPRRYLHTITESARRMGQLIDDLLSLSRLGRKALVRDTVDMASLAAEALHETGPTPAGLEWGELPPAIGDRALLKQVWVNLLSNAIKYSAPRGSAAKISVQGEVLPDGGTAYTVADNGVGFDMRYAGKLFGVFQRLHAQDQFEGTGVGLAITHRIVTRHGGRITAEAEPDRGARFRFELPPEESAE